MKDQINTIREALLDARSLLHDGRRQDKALTALDKIEKMMGSQVPVAWGMQHTDGAILDVISPEEHAREEGGYVVPLYRAAPVAQQPKCVCGQPTALGVVHRTDGPCFVYEAQQPQAEVAEVFHCKTCGCAMQMPHDDCLACERGETQQAEAVPKVQIVNCDTCKHAKNDCDDYPCNRCGFEFGDGPFNRWEAPQQAEAAPAGYVLVPVAVLEAASESLGSFVSDNGWTDADMRAMDNLDAILAQQKGGV